MITLYGPLETDFTHNGLGALTAAEATVTEELNGEFELSLICSLGGALAMLEEDCVIRAGTPRGTQLFRVYNAARRLDGTTSIKARHIFYDNLNNLVERAEANGVTADEAMRLVFGSTAAPHRFNAYSTFDSSFRRDISITNVNPVKGLLRSGTDASEAGIIQLFGGELLRDNFSIALMPTIGAERGFTVRYRKNLTGLTVTTDSSDIVTRLKPVGRIKNGVEDAMLELPEVYADSPNIGLYFMPKIGVLDCPDAKVESGKMTQGQAFDYMRERAAEHFANGADLPKVNAKVDFALLSEAAAGKEYAFLEALSLGDVVSVIHEELGVRLAAKCIKYKWDCLLGRYKEIELGDFNERLGGSIEKRAEGKAEYVSTALTAHIGSAVHLSAAEREWLTKAVAKYPVE